MEVKVQSSPTMACGWHKLLNKWNSIYGWQVEYWGCVPGGLLGW